MVDITVYTRPGCPFSALLLAELRAAEQPFHTVDIWQDREAAAAVRAAADGNETVPTVQIGRTWLVNPLLDEVLDVVHRAA